MLAMAAGAPPVGVRAGLVLNWRPLWWPGGWWWWWPWARWWSWSALPLQPWIQSLAARWTKQSGTPPIPRTMGFLGGKGGILKSCPRVPKLGMRP
jgi:hypothetical protein